MAARDDLIDLYARLPARDVLASPEFRALAGRHVGDTAFEADRSEIEIAKIAVETYMLPGMTAAKELRAALTMLLDYREDVKHRLYYQLISRGYYDHWSIDQQAYFEYGAKKIEAGLDFFLSFTQRYPIAPGENPVNLRYRLLIARVLGDPEYQQADRYKRNLLAESVYKLLKEQGYVDGFFFPDIQYNNSDTLAKLDEAAQGALVFIQLVQNVMFDAPQQPTPNYCWLEFQRALQLAAAEKKTPEDRLKFIVAERNRQTLIPSVRVPADYKSWHAHISGRDAPYLDLEPATDVRVEELVGLIRDKITPYVEGALIQLLEGVPE
ncbi:MAG: hypothetical protein JOZ81_04545 [Chloroflexi bacterium]|nr:hypothetical protein [Chloroflexota bacterium]